MLITDWDLPKYLPVIELELMHTLVHPVEAHLA